VSIVWPCPLMVEAYARLGRAAAVPRPGCPSCAAPMIFWGGYWRITRSGGRCRRVFVRRARCRPCRATHALLPAFVLARVADAAEDVGAVLTQVACGRGARAAAAAAGVPHTTARGHARRFAAVAGQVAVSFAALAVELGGDAVRPAGTAPRRAVTAIESAFAAAAALPGWAPLGPWRFACAVTGGSLLAANASSPFLVIGRRRFMPPGSP